MRVPLEIQKTRFAFLLGLVPSFFSPRRMQKKTPGSGERPEAEKGSHGVGIHCSQSDFSYFCLIARLKVRFSVITLLPELFLLLFPCEQG